MGNCKKILKKLKGNKEKLFLKITEDNKGESCRNCREFLKNKRIYKKKDFLVIFRQILEILTGNVA